MSRGGEIAGSNTAIRAARRLFLRDDNHYGCAEATLVALQQRFGFDDAEDSSVAMALNGGVAYSGGICGALSSAAIVLGRLSAERNSDHQEAKRTARRLMQSLMADFESEFGGSNCSQLIDYKISIPAEHDAFIKSGVWRNTCMAQIEFSVVGLWKLAERDAWDEAVQALDS